MFDTHALELKDQMLVDLDPLTLDLEDDEFIRVIDDSIMESENYYKMKQLHERQQKNLSYYMGKQYKVGLKGQPIFESWMNSPYVENVVYESIRRILPIVASRLPDLTVTAGSDDQELIDNAHIMEDKFNTDATKSDMSKILGLASVQEQIFFYSVIKARWNTELGSDGDYEFLNLYPTNIVWDHTCKTNNADDMRFIAESAELTLKEILMMFPEKADEFLTYLGIEEKKEVDTSERHLASTYKITEVWFHWYKAVDGDWSKVDKINGVVWKYNTFVLGKMKNPYFDYEGKPLLFSKEVKEKGLPDADELYQILFGGGASDTQTVYYNYFKRPRKPYFFMVYESLGEDPIDTTNRIEQILPFQDNINMEGTQIIQMNRQSAGKAVANSDAIDATNIKKIDWLNPSQIISVNGDDVDKAFRVFSMPAATSQLYKSKSENRTIAFEMMGVGQTTRGITQGNNTLGQDQMAREQDYGFLDHLTEETVNDAAMWMAQWKMQFIRLFYTEAHFVDIIGKDGESVYTSLTQDLVSDGMSVVVSASGVDKQMRMQMAVKNMELGVGDVLSYYVDTQQSQPKERARRAFLQKAAPMQYYQEFLAQGDETQGGVPGPVQPGPTNAPPAPGQPPTPPPPGAPQIQMAPAIQGEFAVAGKRV